MVKLKSHFYEYINNVYKNKNIFAVEELKSRLFECRDGWGLWYHFCFIEMFKLIVVSGTKSCICILAFLL